jgi:LCP family protein required for cell wall assembly
MTKKVKITVAVSVLLVLFAVCGYVFRKPLSLWMFDVFFSESVAEQLESTYRPIEDRPQPEPQPIEEDETLKPFSVLLLGIDQRIHDKGRSDTIIYSVIRPEDHRVLLISIPRDSFVEIVGRNTHDKINHAYAFGGAKMSVETVERLLDAPVEHYAAINFQGLVQLIDYLGGLHLELEHDLINRDPAHEKLEVRAGKELYSGEEVLGFLRYREIGGDIGRTQRHQQFLYALLEKMKSAGLVTKMSEMMEVLGNHFQTSMRPEQIIDLGKMAVEWDVFQFTGHTLLGKGKMIDGVWYYELDEQDLADIQSLIRRWLDPETRAPGLQLPVRDTEGSGGS